MAAGAAWLSMGMGGAYKLEAGHEIEKSGLAMITASPEIVVSNHEMINKDIARELAAMGGRYT
ncbi:hypothetical protein CIK87_01705 [Prevotella sp. P5-64]|nr:hypothetical protein CIK87_01705 [Prevotella sp. P5-64]